MGSVERKGEVEALCLGPDEWCVLAPDKRRDALIEASRAAYAKIPHAFCDVSDREVVLRLSGPEALTALTTGIARDIESMEVGSAARTAFDTATVILWRDDENSFRMDVWRSFLPHVRALLDLAQAEFAAGL
ncbi:sarcosine oxidase subunit gamma [Oricola nitratireducens]|uniref:sarcosine oxidase subunit gamma n=1 Tax=Oricola nitratireducens TaxID=2775868 RepID=UPI003D17B486